MPQATELFEQGGSLLSSQVSVVDPTSWPTSSPMGDSTLLPAITLTPSPAQPCPLIYTP